MDDVYVLRHIRSKNIIWEGTYDECEDQLHDLIAEEWFETAGPDDRDYDTFLNNHLDLYVIEERQKFFKYVANNF
jgi:hypothetical protein